ncbi:DUF1194 domain-containing protein [Loktanella sp. M215]|uniref:DUF1194 domain-containing protein n=1 Tax=Loktanella sp. M215 TaxID=2675431 RepID=UPI001F4098DE|nr:DUF1194 domain-containing protein [Loktanella sp. M215]MCF7697955.1 DUF1194 domain-containing protein [Loktanella sp. M215]
MWSRVACLLGGVFLAHPAQACRLALVLAMDVSSSVDATEDALQRQGLARALIDPAVMEAFFATDDPVALNVFEWSGRYNQAQLADWTLIRSPADLTALSQRIATSRRSHNDFPTALGYALGYAAGLLQTAPACLFQTVDVAGDGINNEGFGPEEAYTAFPFDDVTVNGLVVNAADVAGEVGLIPYYRDHVIHGPAAFIEIASHFDDYAEAMRRKLIRELGAPMLGGLPACLPRG